MASNSAIEVLSRLRLPIPPVDPFDVARLADLAGIGGIGVFWFEYEEGSGALYFVSTSGLSSPFELDDGNLYYLPPEAV